VNRPPGLPRRNAVPTRQNGFEATAYAECDKQAALAEQIRKGWTETLERIIDTGVCLTSGRFRKADYQRHRLPFSYSWGRKLQRIARSPRILDPVNRTVLPSKVNALYQIALMSDRLFELGVKEGIINNQTLVFDLKYFRQSFVEPGRCRRRRMTIVFECDPGCDRDALEGLDSFVVAVEGLATGQFPTISVRRPRTIKELSL
jgi:hypothetical protein